MPHLFIFGLGYSAKRIRAATEALGWRVTSTGAEAELDFADEERVRAALGAASHVLSSVPPAETADPVLARYGDALGHGWLGRSVLERLAEGRAHRIDLPGQVFSRIHVDDIAGGVIAALEAPPGAYNLADDLPASQNAVIEEACRLLGVAPPPLQSLDAAGLSPQARAFYAENRRVANGKARRLLGWAPKYPTFREGLAAST